MSLINDALRKARQEAAERDSEQRGTSYQPPRAHLPAQSRMGMGLVLGIGVGFLIAFAAAAFFFANQTPAPGPTVAEAKAGEEAKSGVEAKADATLDTESSSQLLALEESGTDNSPSATPVQPAPLSPEGGNLTAEAATRPAATEKVAEVNSATPSPTAAQAPRGIETASSPESSQTPRGELAEAGQAGSSDHDAQEAIEIAQASSRNPGAPNTSPFSNEAEPLPPKIKPPESVGQVKNTNVFVLQADLGDVTLVLDFIAWVPGRPFAQINGEQVEEDQIIEGLLVEKIERDRVTLRGADGSLVLRVR